MAAVETSSIFRQPKIVDKALTLPLVSDTYSYGKDEIGHTLGLSLCYDCFTHRVIEVDNPSVTCDSVETI